MKRNILLFALTLLVNLSALSQAGTPDNNFGTNGRVNLPIGVYDDHAYAVAIQPDGKIVIAGPSRTTVNDPTFGNRYDFALSRLNPDGTLDDTFDGDNGNGNGKVIISVGDYGGFAHAVKIQPDGRIVIAGYALNTDDLFADYAIIRLETNGNLDGSFGDNGKKYISIGPMHDLCYAMALQPDGKIVLAGESNPSTGGRVFSAARLTSTGSLDPLFNNGAPLLIPINSITNEAASAVAIQPDGKILLAGSGSTSNPELRHFALARLNEDGSTDSGFDVDGQIVLLTNNSSFCRAMVLQPDGKILLAGGSGFLATTADFQIVRLESNGSYDNSFDFDGRVLMPVGTGIDEAYSIALQPDGKIVVAGQSQNESSFNFSAIRLNTNGILDICFDSDGKVILPSTTPGGFGERNRAMELQPDGRIVLVGINGGINTIPTDPAIDFIVMRLNGGSGSAEDNDGDGYNGCVDCDDNNPNINPGATEICNGIDDDCDGQVDEGLTTTFYRDFDGDGFGSSTNTIQACTVPAGYVTNNTDCDDTKILYADNDDDGYGTGSPAACGVENNTDCNDANANVHTNGTYYQDADNDGFGDPNSSVNVCQSIPPAGYVTNNSDCDDTKLLYVDNDADGYGAGAPVACGVATNTDCNDNDPTINPGALENVCNGIDNDCDGEIDEDTPKFTYYFDGDGDGWGIASQTIQACAFPAGYAVNPGDCNDINPTIHPGATEVCNGIDEDCDGQIDEGAESPWYIDNDGDGYGNSSQFVLACTQPAGYIANGGDCNDDPATGGASIHPGATEICNGIDDDCDGVIDEGLTLNTYYRDVDGDGYGITLTTVQACTPPAGYVSQAGDCNDNDATANPAATEICNLKDDNCDGQVDEGFQTQWYIDNDGDGYGNPAGPLTTCTPPQGYVANNGDCDDNDATVNPAALEICNLKDDDCDGQIDEGFTIITYYKDADGDGYGDANISVQACTPPPGYVTNNTDCDDGNDTIHPNATEYCNGIDENCNGIIDDNPVLVTWYRDADEDGWGNPNQTVQACTPPAGYIRESFDCDDTNPEINPEATEIDNNLDDDCDGQIDEDVLLTFYRDADSDGYGDPLNSTQASTQPVGYVDNNTDCNDNNALIHPGAAEICNGIDDNCNGQTDEGVKLTFYRDADNDGFGDLNNTTQACTQPAGYADNNTDCNDNDAGIHPGATEICNGIDDNCNGQTDEDVKLTFYIDADSDGFGDPNNTTQACTVPAGYVTNNSDCDDTKILYADNDGDGYGSGTPAACGVALNNDCNDNNSAIHPGAVEICNDTDDDCDGSIDEGVTLTFYQDADNDGFGNPNQTIQACTVPAGYTINNTDCDDTQLLYGDTDGDGFGAGVPVACGVISNTDCNDNDPAINPNTIWYLDADNDNYYTGSGLTQCVSPGTGYKNSGLIAGGDCNDNNANVNPGRLELCDNNIDDNCNGQIDENCALTITINDVTVYESQGQAVLTVSLSKPATAAIKVNFKTIDGTAVKPKDYKNTNGSITIAAGSVSALITIPIMQDNINEGPEYFDVQISLPKVNGQQQAATIIDDMGRVSILNGVSPALTKTFLMPGDNKSPDNKTGDFNVIVTPNPSLSDFIMHVQSSTRDPIDLTIFDVQGRLVKQLRSVSTNLRFGSDLRSGIYLVEVRQAATKRSLKLIKL